jgi:hypothetical protein
MRMDGNEGRRTVVTDERVVFMIRLVLLKIRYLGKGGGLF